MTRAEWKAANSKACPDCGRMVSMGGNAMKQHRASKHPVTRASRKPDAAVRAETKAEVTP